MPQTLELLVTCSCISPVSSWVDLRVCSWVDLRVYSCRITEYKDRFT